MLNARRQALLRYLAGAGGPVPAACIGADLGLSPRQVRYDLQALTVWLRQRRVEVVSRRGSGIQLRGDLAALRAELGNGHGPSFHRDYALSPAERRLILAAILLRADRPIPLPDLAIRIDVSRATVLGDLENLAAWLEAYGLSLERMPARGVRVAGPEAGWRRALGSVLVELLGQPAMARLLHAGRPADGSPVGSAPTGAVPAAMRAVRQAAAAHHLTLSDRSVEQVAVRLVVAAHRLSQGNRLPDSGSLPSVRRSDPEWPMALSLCRDMEKAWGVEFPPAEVAEVATLLAASEPGPRADQLPRVAMAEEVVAQVLAARIEALLATDLRQDRDLIAGLAAHLRALRYRLEVMDPFARKGTGSLLGDLARRYPAVVRAVGESIRLLEDEWGLRVPAEEVEPVAVLVAAALERRRVRLRDRCRVVVACGAGLATAQLIAARIRAELPELDVLGVTSVLSIAEEGLPADADLVVSTSPFETSDVPVVCVSPLLPDPDLERLRDVVHQCWTHKRAKERPPVLAEVMTEATMMLDADAADWRAAVRVAGELLVRAEAVEERYVAAMVRAVEELGPYVVIAPGIALPHARPEEGVRRIAISFVRLRKPVPFGHPQNDPVDLVFAVAAVDAETHLKALMQLSELLSSREGLQTLRQARNPAEVLAAVAAL